MNCTYGFEETEIEKRVLDFFVKANDCKDIVFVDDNPIVFKEHKFWSDRDGYQRFTCIGVDCPLCRVGHQAKKVFCLTAIDENEWVDKSGNIHGQNKVLFIAPMNIAPILKREKEKRGTLVGNRYRVTRTERIAPSVGNSFEFLGKADVSNHEKVNYESYFQPLPIQKLEEVARKYF